MKFINLGLIAIASVYVAIAFVEARRFGRYAAIFPGSIAALLIASALI